MKSGILVVNKPEGISSARVVSKVKKALNVKKVGHTGTLDPFATGVLLCAINKGTKISRFFLGGNKRYLARVCLGIETDTYDRTGQVIFTAPQERMAGLDVIKIQGVINSFAGVQEQVPPVYSALKHEGQPLYKLARQGKAVEKPSRRIEIFDIQIKQLDLPFIDIDVSCSSGTYIRSIAFDIGRKLECGAHLTELCRTRSSAFALEDAIGMEELENQSITVLNEKIIPMSSCLDFLPKLEADDRTAAKIGFGQKLTIGDFSDAREVKQYLPEDQAIRVVDKNGELLAIVSMSENGQAYNYSCVFSS